MQTFLVGTLLIWIIWFGLMLVPAYWVCRRFLPAQQAKPHPLGYLFLAVVFAMYSHLAALIVLIIVIAGEFFVFGPTPWLAPVMNDLKGFGTFLAVLLFVVPTYAALIVGYRKLRREMFDGDAGLRAA
ncbi:MAG: hypothetical protein EON54_28105 [Alcaligenaceae bacterium]|nr:MAG: hypothetical protein EON54_28105 [Alcaligenaceae bacterium]